MNIKKEIGEKIKRLRKRRGLTQESLVEMVDISSRNLSNIELGVSFPKPETLEKILTSLNSTTQELFTNNHIKTNEDLIKDILSLIDLVKNDNKTLEKIYKITKSLVEDI